MSESTLHYCRVDEVVWDDPSEGPDSEKVPGLRKKIEPWFASLFQSEHLSVLLGSGFTLGICNEAEVSAADMSSDHFDGQWGDKIEKWAKKTAKEMGRGNANIEDRIRCGIDLLNGLEIMEDEGANKVRDSINRILLDFLRTIIQAERDYKSKLFSDPEGDTLNAVGLMVSFILSFASRMGSRDRLNVFTTNYDRFIEYACDRAGIRLIDRFVGSLTPIFRASRLDVDFHYNPPGIRGEPRFLEGVAKFTKLHGSLDWISTKNGLIRTGLPFGAKDDHPEIPVEPLNTLMIYPNSAKDIETSMYPYVELFRDFSAGICRPNSTLVTYGYGFGDDHINRIIKDMLTLPSTHLAIIAHSDSNGRISKFCGKIGHKAQITLLLGSHFGNIKILVNNYLPKPAIDNITWRKAELLKRRGVENSDGDSLQQCGVGDLED